ncbi:MAG: UDP-3-O-(3-hydroxymyristoyl)glucosamine N-acyltransferase [Ignavibacteriae bacterium]|nr:UDP-3-O-(3-hydroxymyristoyl)glucosamine N-acyltransferase [Ignavibacteriota bacterium]
MNVTVHELAALLGGRYSGPGDVELRGLAPIDSAEQGDITFLANKKYDRFLATTRASAIILDETLPFLREDVAVIRVKDPYLSFALALRHFHPAPSPRETEIHPSAIIDPSARIGARVRIGAGVVVEAGAAVGDGTVLHAGAVIGEGVHIGEQCLIYPNVSILARASIGNRVIIHGGATIGSDGFGFAPAAGSYMKIPQVGSVVIGDDVEIGANSTVDRGALGDTIIRRGAKLDNLIQIAHNVIVGEDTVIAAQAGISGSTTLGSHVIIAGQAGLVGHIEIAENVTVGAQSGVSKSIMQPGKTYRGSPAHEIHDELRQEAAMRQVPDLIATVRTLEARLREAEEELRALRDGAHEPAQTV